MINYQNPTQITTCRCSIRVQHRGAVQLDVDQLERHASASEWCAAAALVAGEFLEGFAVPGTSEFEDWLTAERTRWRSRSVESLVHCAEERLASGQARDAAAIARQAVKLDPHSDPAVRAAIRSLALAGERAAALECYDSFASRLREERGVEGLLPAPGLWTSVTRTLIAACCHHENPHYERRRGLQPRHSRAGAGRFAVRAGSDRRAGRRDVVRERIHHRLKAGGL